MGPFFCRTNWNWKNNERSMEKALGVNLFKYGFVGSTDDHMDCHRLWNRTPLTAGLTQVA